ncbi:MAG: tetratricopeptide repeat protein [Dysgonamonadaceae bacterium]|jgi:hypothetical protein|nr:tetratricopeptide repeat protein [Dysgonamonadaceae bacterium]
MMKKSVLIFSLLIGISSISTAQKQVRKDIRAGNKDYKKENYTDASVEYQRALEANAHSTEAAYNLGNTFYKQGKGKEAMEQYIAVTNNETDKTKLAKAWHNVGNICLSSALSKEVQPQEKGELLNKSIEAYKKALRNNPKDDETRYNLALAQKLREDAQNQNQNDDQNKDQQQDQQNQDQQQNQDKQDQNQDQQNQEQQNQNQQNQEQNQKEQQSPDKMSKETADQILNALMQEEKNTQGKLDKKQKVAGKQIDKKW